MLLVLVSAHKQVSVVCLAIAMWLSCQLLAVVLVGAADVVTLGDTWVAPAIRQRLIQPLPSAETYRYASFDMPPTDSHYNQHPKSLVCHVLCAGGGGGCQGVGSSWCGAIPPQGSCLSMEPSGAAHTGARGGWLQDLKCD